MQYYTDMWVRCPISQQGTGLNYMPFRFNIYATHDSNHYNVVWNFYTPTFWARVFIPLKESSTYLFEIPKDWFAFILRSSTFLLWHSKAHIWLVAICVGSECNWMWHILWHGSIWSPCHWYRSLVYIVYILITDRILIITVVLALRGISSPILIDVRFSVPSLHVVRIQWFVHSSSSACSHTEVVAMLSE